jgi:hypothetical protein
VKQNPAANRPALAGTLNSLGFLYTDMKRFAEAETAYQEAITTERELTEQKSRPFIGPTWQRRSITWALSTPTWTVSPRPRPP